MTKPILSASISTAIALAILCALGTWQLQRRAWKNALLADIDRAEQSPAVPLGAGIPPRFTKIAVSGTWLPATALYGVEVREPPTGGTVIGAQRLQVLARDGASPVLVDEGWIPTEGKPLPAATGPARVEGYVRLADKPNFLSAEDDPAAKHFYTLDPGAIGAALGVTNLAPFTVVAMGAAPPGAPAPATELPRPPNNHLQYAFTWFGLAAALAGVFAVWVRKPADT